VVLPTPLPRLQTLVLGTAGEDSPVPVIRQLVGGAACLTQLQLYGIGSEGGKNLVQLGALPALQVLQLVDPRDHDDEHYFETLSEWLQQQEHVTSLVLHLPGRRLPRSESCLGPARLDGVRRQLVTGLPPHLEQLQLGSSDVWSLPECLEGSTSLRVLKIYEGGLDGGLPEWVTSLTALEELHYPGGYADWEQVAQLPLLRGIWSEEYCYARNVYLKARLLEVAPHLCWAK
jgi:hypothetical protein